MRQGEHARFAGGIAGRYTSRQGAGNGGNSRSGHERGFALVAALWLLATIGAVMLDLSLRARQRRLVAANAVEAAAARLAAEAGLEHALQRLAARAQASESLAGTLDPELLWDPWAGADTVLRAPVPIGHATYRLSLGDPGAALHLNLASEDQLRTFFAAFGLDFGEADRLAQRIADWRDPDQVRRPRGAERADYLARGRLVLPADRPFERVDELRDVEGMTEALYRRVAPHLTLLGSGRVNLRLAPRPVLLTLPGFGEEAVRVLEHVRRTRRPLSSVYELALALSPPARAALEAELPRLAMLTTLETAALVVVSEGEAEDGRFRARVEALVVRAGGGARVAWRRAE